MDFEVGAGLGLLNLGGGDFFAVLAATGFAVFLAVGLAGLIALLALGGDFFAVLDAGGLAFFTVLTVFAGAFLPLFTLGLARFAFANFIS